MSFKFLDPQGMEARRRKTFDGVLRDFGKRFTDQEVEMRCFKSLPIGNPLKGDFCISLAQMRWDFLYIEKDGIENFWFTRMLRTLCMHRKVYMVGSASSGKTFGASVFGMNTWGSSPWNTTFLVTSTDAESLDAKAWGTIKDLHEKDKFGIGVRLNYEDAIVLEGNAKKRDIRDAIKAIPLPKGSEGEKGIGKVQGRKNANILWLGDEWAHMDGFVRGAISNLRSAMSFSFVACSNKPEEGDPMYLDALPDPEEHPLGWESPGLSDHDGWKTANGGYCLYFDGEKSPNTLAEAGKPDPFPMLTRRDYIAGVLKDEGEDGYGYWKYVKAFPRTGESHDKVLNVKLLERHGALQGPIWAGGGWITVAGLDPSWTKGGDDAMADFARVGFSDSGKKIMAHEPDCVKLNAKMSGSGTFEEQIAEAFIKECQKRDCHVVAIDISGSGGRVANEVRNAADRMSWKLEIITVDSAGAPDENETYEVGDATKNGREAFDRRVSEIWVSYRLSIQAGLIRGLKTTSKAVRELCERRASQDEKKRYELEDKKKYKKRNNGKSPDSAESRVLCHFAARKHGLGSVPSGLRKAQEAQKQISRELGGGSQRRAYSAPYTRRGAYSAR